MSLHSRVTILLGPEILRPPVVLVGIGCRVWRDASNEPHREDGPAIEAPDGDKAWYCHGRLVKIEHAVH